jgi:hypothetical protein
MRLPLRKAVGVGMFILRFVWPRRGLDTLRPAAIRLSTVRRPFDATDHKATRSRPATSFCTILGSFLG